MPKRSDKRERLVKAAKALIHQQGYNETTLADIAQASDVPLGNVYYYFKTKDAIAEAVLVERANELKAQFSDLAQLPNTKDRLCSLVQNGLQALADTLQYGCAMGSLCQELSKQGGVLSDKAAELMKSLVQWLEQQFHALGQAEKASQMALYLLANLQGISLLASTFKDEEMVSRQRQMLCQWIENV